MHKNHHPIGENIVSRSLLFFLLLLGSSFCTLAQNERPLITVSGQAEMNVTPVINAGINRIEGVDFRTTQIRAHKDRARQMAIKAAQEKAIALAREIGQTIGKAYSITEEGTGRDTSSNNFSVSNARGSLSGDYSMPKERSPSAKFLLSRA